MGIPEHLTCLLRNLYVGEEVTLEVSKLEADMEQWTGSKLGKEYVKAVYCHPCLFNLYAEYNMWNADWMEHKPESRLQGEVSIISDMQMTPPLWQKVKRN